MLCCCQPDNNEPARCKQAMNLSSRLLNLLLLTLAVLLATSVGLSTYFFLQFRGIEKLKVSLLSRAQLQSEILGAQPEYYSAFPHMVKDIGFVLNPSMLRTSLWAAEGDSYPINSLGLRGEEIGPKRAGASRILIVGDSIVFGWKLKEKDRLSSILNQRIAERTGGEANAEFITVALPGWNVKSARAFLDSHIRLLDPDLILWWSIPNDIEDVGGAIPPGVIAHWASPHDKDQSSFASLSALHKRSGPFMPIIAAKMNENLSLITSFQSSYKIPVILLGLPPIKERSTTALSKIQQIYLPPKYPKDKRWRLSLVDGHPTPWANQIIATGILNKLSRSGLDLPFKFTPEEKVIARDFEVEESIEISKSDNPKDFTRALVKIPSNYIMGNPDTAEAVLTGISPSGEMSRVGTLFLRDPGNSSFIKLSVATIANIDEFPSKAIFKVRSRHFLETQTSIELRDKQIELKLPLPKSPAGERVFEVSWKYDFTHCSAPNHCIVGNLLYAGFE